MAITEVALLTLALNLMNSPTDRDIQTYSNLTEFEKNQIEEIIHEQDVLPYEFQELKSKSDEKLKPHSPTTETSCAGN